ncbi:MAG: adenylosuccinate synthetase, partial [Armatimonadetes bacterium]|nr:adenylosuccinate synthetase [Armatimonadota bacterium]
GRPRRCGWLDLVAVRYAARLCGVTELVLTGLGVLSGVDELKVCVGYQRAGVALSSFPADGAALAEVEPVYETLPGYRQPLDNCRSFADLPAETRAYIELIEAHAGKVGLICVGRRRDQVIAR